MVDINQLIGNRNIAALDPSLTQRTPEQQKKPGEVGKDEFLQLLVTQLKHQDPLDPMKNEDFAVNLAQFSQLEQLIEINNNISGDASSAAGMSGYLGQQVLLNTNVVTVKGGNGGMASFNLATDAAGIKVELLDAQGAVRDSFDLPAIKAGEHTLDLQGLNVPNGAYTVQVTALTPTGAKVTPEVFASGVVTGFVPGADPKLIVNGNQISPADVKEVRTPLA